MRFRAVDWLRGLVIALMTVDHAGNVFDAAHMHGDTARTWVRGSPLPAGEFLTRWITHLCAPTFVLLAGASLAFSTAKRGASAAETRFLVTRGLLIAALDPLWMTLGFADGYSFLIFQVLYAIGMSMVCMAWLRRLPSGALLTGVVLIEGLGELTARWHPTSEPWRTLDALLFVSGPVGTFGFVAYPLVPWLAYMILGCVLGRWMLATDRDAAGKARALTAAGLALLALFMAVRGFDGYGNWNLHRDSGEVLQWLHVSKYPPSVAFGGLELGIGLLALAVFVAIDVPGRPRPALSVLLLLGSTAFFYYLLHVHLLRLAQTVLHLDTHVDGLAKTWGAALLTLLALLGPCAWYRRYKRAHPDGWTRYV